MNIFNVLIFFFLFKFASQRMQMLDLDKTIKIKLDILMVGSLQFAITMGN